MMIAVTNRRRCQMSLRLSPPFHELANLIGQGNAVILSKEVGGTDIYIPSAARMKPDSRIVLVVGEEAARALASKYASAMIAVPAGPGRRARICEAHASGMKIHAIARMVGVHERTVYQTLARERAAKEQS